MARIIKAYTIYFHTQNNSCLNYFAVDGTNKKKALKLGKAMAKLLEEYYSSELWPIVVKATVEEYKSPLNKQL